MNEATGEIRCREGAVVRCLDGNNYEFVRVTADNANTRLWTAFDDGQIWNPDDGPETTPSFNDCTGEDNRAWIGKLALQPVTRPPNPKQAYGDKKIATWAVPPALTLGAAKAFGEGAPKYGAFNWRETRVEAMTYVGAMLRHLYAYMDGEDVDPESATGKLHLEGIAACVGILLDGTYGDFLIDNRPPKGPAPEMVLTPKEKK